MKSVLISIQPKWCELIASGKKTVEVRKTKPKIEVPFKCYIYMTKGFASYPVRINGYPYMCHNNGGMEVIGEFVCDQIFKINGELDETFINSYDCGWIWTGDDACLSYFELDSYLKGKNGYGWHISDLVIYDKPKELSEFGVKRPFQSWGYVYEAD
jgi:predicted transcriptional regulator